MFVVYIKNRNIGEIFYSSDLSIVTIIFSGIVVLRFTSGLLEYTNRVNWDIVSLYVAMLMILLLASVINFAILRLGDTPSSLFYVVQIFLFVVSLYVFVVFGGIGELFRGYSTDRKITELEEKIMDLKKRLSELESFDKRARKEGGVFISYSHKDKEIVQRIVDNFRNDDINYWLDDEDMPIGQVIDKAVSQGIQQYWLFLIMLSPSSVKSRWVEREFDEASHEEIAGKKIILPVLCNGLKDEDVPARIRRKKYVDLSSDFEASYLLLKRSILHYLKEFRSAKKTSQRNQNAA